MDPRIAVVTGAGTGIGLAISARLTQQNSHKGLVLLGRRRNVVEDAAHRLQKNATIPTIGMSCDVGDPAQIKSVLTDAKTVMGIPEGKIASLVNAAGVVNDSLLLRAKDSDIENTLRVNLMGPIFMARAVLPDMLRIKGEGRKSIVNIGSVIASIGNPGQTVYGASKSGLVGLTKSLAKEMASKNICVNLVEPGFIKTDMTANQSEMDTSIPLGRFGEVEEVASWVEFLICNKDAGYATGQVFRVDGGLSS